MGSTVALPSLGESVVEATIGKWLVKQGDRVDKDQPLVEVLTDKADSEVRAPAAGIVARIVAVEGTTVPVGGALCELDAAAGSTSGGFPVPRAAPAIASAPVEASPSGGVGAAASPSTRKLAREQGVDLKKLTGSGEGGRATRDDVLRAAAQSAAAAAPATGTRAIAPTSVAVAPTAAGAVARAGAAFQLPPYVPKPGDEVIAFSRRRRIIADHMVYSKLTSPHVVTVAECDLQKTARMRDLHKAALKAEGVNLTFLSFIASATCRALREHRVLNARVLDDAFVLLREVNLGIAVDTEEGLVVPVVRGADELSVRGLARAIDELARKARDGKLVPDDLSAKTFTVSNPGLKGNLFGAAIISQPNVGILRVGEIQKRVVVVEHDGEDLMAIRPVMHLALSYDHRIVDGVAANGFLWRVVEILEAGDFVI